jgi:hypothetical protein
MRSGVGTMADVRVALVNHNTSTYAELALRSLIALNGGVDLDITVIGNASDETSHLFSWARQQGIEVKQSGFTIANQPTLMAKVIISLTTRDVALTSSSWLAGTAAGPRAPARRTAPAAQGLAPCGISVFLSLCRSIG